MQNLESITKKSWARRIAERTIQAAGLYAAVVFGGGCDDDNGGNEDTTGPSITVTAPLADDYEGNTSIGLSVTDASGVASVTLQYRAAGSSDAYQSVSTTSAGGAVALPSDVLDTRIVATDTVGNATTVDNGTVEVYALNTPGVVEVEAALAAYKLAGDIHDYVMNKVFDDGTSQATPEAAVLVKNPSYPTDPNEGWWVAVHYVGEGESATSGPLKTAIDTLATMGVQSTTIGGAADDRIRGLMDDALAANFAGGSYKALKAVPSKEVTEIF